MKSAVSRNQREDKAMRGRHPAKNAWGPAPRLHPPSWMQPGHTGHPQPTRITRLQETRSNHKAEWLPLASFVGREGLARRPREQPHRWLNEEEAPSPGSPPSPEGGETRPQGLSPKPWTQHTRLRARAPSSLHAVSEPHPPRSRGGLSARGPLASVFSLPFPKPKEWISTEV